MEIPKEFVKTYGNQVTLKVLADAEWKIGLTRSDGIVWLQNGWKEFIDYYSLAHGHFLVFRHEDKSCFSVTIFDIIATEIDYPYEEKESETEETEDHSVSV
ncbi:hypothetical protein ACFE04_022304 [Oxalis oulophora]